MSTFSRFMRFLPTADAEPRKPRIRGKSAASDTLTPTVDERTAETAKMILDNPAFEIVFERLRAQRLSEIVYSGPLDLTQREDAYRGISALDKIRDDLSALADELKLHARNKERTGN